MPQIRAVCRRRPGTSAHEISINVRNTQTVEYYVRQINNDGEAMTWKCDSCGFDNSDEYSIRCACGNERQENKISANVSGKRPLFWVGEILSAGGLIFCMMGYAMVASFSVAAPERRAHWESMAWLYVGGIAVCSILMVVFAVAIFRFSTKKTS